MQQHGIRPRSYSNKPTGLNGEGVRVSRRDADAWGAEVTDIQTIEGMVLSGKWKGL